MMNMEMMHNNQLASPLGLDMGQGWSSSGKL